MWESPPLSVSGTQLVLTANSFSVSSEKGQVNGCGWGGVFTIWIIMLRLWQQTSPLKHWKSSPCRNTSLAKKKYLWAECGIKKLWSQAHKWKVKNKRPDKYDIKNNTPMCIGTPSSGCHNHPTLFFSLEVTYYPLRRPDVGNTCRIPLLNPFLCVNHRFQSDI